MILQKWLIPFFFLWELPQNTIGLVLFLLLRISKKIQSVEYHKRRILIQAKTAISLGFFVFWNHDDGNPIFSLSSVNKFHELGHSIQSKILGPLYLPLVGFPSGFRSFYARWYYKKNGIKWEGYYKGYPENWADRLGKVDSSLGKATI